MIKKAKLIKGKSYNGTIVGAGGELKDLHYCNSFVEFPNDKKVAQFILADISHVKDSIYKETGIEILGIISLPQMKFLNIQLDLANENVLF